MTAAGRTEVAVLPPQRRRLLLPVSRAAVWSGRRRFVCVAARQQSSCTPRLLHVHAAASCLDLADTRVPLHAVQKAALWGCQELNVSQVSRSSWLVWPHGGRAPPSLSSLLPGHP